MTMTFLRPLLFFLLLLVPLINAALPNAEIHVHGGPSYFATFASFGSRQTVTGRVKLPPSNVDPRLCDEFLNYSTIDWDGDIMLVPRGNFNCTFQRKAWNAQQMGAASILVYNTLESRYKKNGTAVVYPLDKVDYECDNGYSVINNLTLDPPLYNGSYHDAFLTSDSDNNKCLVQDETRCESRRCLVTGPVNTTTTADASDSSNQFEACCAWDISMTMAGDATVEGNVKISAVFVTMRQADDLLLLVEDDNATITIQERPSRTFNVSSLLLWGMAIGIVTFASWYSVKDYRQAKIEWQLCFQQSVARHVREHEEARRRQEQNPNETTPLDGVERGDAMNDDTVDPESQVTVRHENNEVVSSEDALADASNDPEDSPSDPEAARGDESAPEQEQQNASTPQSRDQPQALELNAWHAAGFVIVASTILLVLFYFKIYSWVTVLYGIGCSGAIAQLIFSPSYHWIGHRSKLLSTCCFAPITSITRCECNTIQWVDVFAAATGYTIGALWLFVGFTDNNAATNPFYWITQNVMGACVSILFLSLLRLSSIKVATILLVATFLYDVFFVFITPYIFNGDSIMVTVATGGGGPEASADFCEKYPDDSKCQGGNPLPLLLTIPRINDYRGGSSLLGLGDIVIPGLLLAFGARLDDARRLVGSLTNIQGIKVPKHWYNGYLFPLVVAYAIGLLAANIAVVLMQRGQPALLYIVPACLGTVFVVGRKELGELWRGPQVIQTANRIVRLDPNPSSLRVTPASEGEQEEEQTSNSTQQATTISGSVRPIS